MERYTIKDFNKRFPNNDTCLEWLKNFLYPNGITCKSCGKITSHSKLSKTPVYSCNRCGNHFHPMAGTIFEDSHTPLTSWFYAIFLISTTRCGISAKQLQRELGVTYKTAWRMYHQIRKLLNENSPLSGVIEIDETYVGGVDKGKFGHGGDKIPVVGIVQRRGGVRAKVTNHVAWAPVITFIENNVTRRSLVCTDESTLYRHLKDSGYIHRSINHKSKQYVNGYIHTNTIEGFWSLVKRGISGVYHSVSPKYLQQYVNEYAFRYSHRKDTKPMFWSVLGQIKAL